jgi:DNA-binding CsgD family transcriptional regulator
MPCFLLGENVKESIAGFLECSELERRKNNKLRKYIQQLEFNNSILQAEQDLSPDGILVVDEHRKMVSFNKQFVTMWDIPPAIHQCRDDRKSIQSVLDKLKYPRRFLQKVEYLMANPTLKSRDELELLDGRFFERYSAPIYDEKKDIRGRIWFFRDITEIKRVKAQLEEQNQWLEERVRLRTAELENLNTTLQTLLHSLEKEKKTLEKQTLDNFQKALLPFFDSLRETSLSARQNQILDMMEKIMADLLAPMNSSFLQLRNPLTSTEIKVANCVRMGKTSKEIAEILCCSERTVEGHRSALRRKLGLKKGDNLYAHLQKYS